MESMAINKRESPSGSGVTGRIALAARPWAHLSPDLLLDVSNRLDDAGDFARFHAVCMPWRAAAPSLYSPAATRPTFPSWHLALCGGHITCSTVDIRCVTSFEEAGCRGRIVYDDVRIVEPQGAPSSVARGRNWVASSDGTGSWLFIASPEPRLVHLLTGVIVPLPQFPDDEDETTTMPMQNLRGIVYGDRTVFLYSFLDNHEKKSYTFSAAILLPGDTEWTFMRRFLEVPAAGYRYNASAVYHDGEVLICTGYFWSLLTRGDLGDLAGLQSRWCQIEDDKYSREYSYLLVSRGELLWASVLLLKRGRDDDPTSSLSVTVHALEKGAGGAVRWVRRDGWSLADRVLFLAFPASFATDAHQLGVVGGRAYFVYKNCVFRYGLVDGETELVKQLRPLRDGAGVWLPRQPTISPIQEIRERLSLYPN